VDCEFDSGDEDGCGCEDRFGEGEFLLFLFCPFFLAHVPSPNQNVIEINRPPLPVYQNVIEKTRQLAVRTQALGVAIARSGQGAAVQPPKPDQPAQAVTVS
jgi:hypothetical protein